MNQPQDTQNASQAVENPTQNKDPISMMIAARNKRLSGESSEDSYQNSNDDNNDNDDIYGDIKFLDQEEYEKSNQGENKSHDEENHENKKPVKTYSEEEYNKINSRLNENRNYSHTVNKKLTSVTNIINELVQNGDLSEEHAESISKIIKNNDVKKPEGLTESPTASLDPFQKFIDIANPLEIENYVNYTGDEQYIDKIKAYNHFMYQEATLEEKQKIYAELSEFEKSPAKLVKKMMEIGDNFLKEGFDEFLQSGSIRKYIQSTKQKLINKEKEFDKINRDKVKSDYDEPTYGFEKYSSSFVNTKQKNDANESQAYDSNSAISQVFKARDKRLASQRRK